jgi:hypothetical protein
MGDPWSLEVGASLLRRRVHELFGGQQQGGISTPANSRHILIFTDPAKGKKFGYDLFEGEREDGCFSYTGQGQIGDQKFANGNKALLDSQQDGRTIRLFRTSGTLATYVGSYNLGTPPYVLRDAIDAEGNNRTIIVFNLEPLATLDNEGSMITNASKPAGRSLVSWKPLDETDYYIVTEAKELEEKTASRIEFQLQNSFGLWLQSQGHVVSRLTLKIGDTSISPDLFDETSNMIVEAKKSSSRGHVRTAIGQILDYQNIEFKNGHSRNCGILLPGRPADDLVDLCRRLGIKVLVPENPENIQQGFVECTKRTGE